MQKAVSTLIFLVLASFVFPISMNEQGNFISVEKSELIQFFSEGQSFVIDNNKLLATNDSIYLNGEMITKLKHFYKIISCPEKVYIITRNTIFNFTDFDLKPIITFQDQIYDIAYCAGDFHISLKRNIYNGIKFTHNVYSENKKVSRVDYKILDMKKIHSAQKTTNTTATISPYNNFRSFVRTL